MVSSFSNSDLDVNARGDSEESESEELERESSEEDSRKNIPFRGIMGDMEDINMEESYDFDNPGNTIRKESLMI